MVAKYLEMFSTVILLILLAVFILHLIRGDAMEWLSSKFRTAGTFKDTKLPNALGTK